jgi:primase-polymerase (primpol)-like protein
MQSQANQAKASPRSSPPTTIEVPEELRALRQWVAWDYRMARGQWSKVPHRITTSRPSRSSTIAEIASTTDPSTWASYEAARHHPKIGFVFTAHDPFCGVDLDDCLDPDTGEISLVARVAIRYLASYAEVSPSGRGVKIVGRGRVPGERRQHRALGVEMYDQRRFFALTGTTLPGVPEHLADVDLAPLHRWIFGPPDRSRSASLNTAAGSGRCSLPRRWCRRLSDEAIIARALGARNGWRFERLWRGDASGYPTHSEADLALCAMLAYWCDGDPVTMENLFSRSGLCREKWLARPDYRRRTILRALITVCH